MHFGYRIRCLQAVSVSVARLPIKASLATILDTLNAFWLQNPLLMNCFCSQTAHQGSIGYHFRYSQRILATETLLWKYTDFSLKTKKHPTPFGVGLLPIITINSCNIFIFLACLPYYIPNHICLIHP